MLSLAPRLAGARVKRVEDPRFLRGGGAYLDDLRIRDRVRLTNDIKGITSLHGVSLVLAQLISNVPLTILLLPIMESHATNLRAGINRRQAVRVALGGRDCDTEGRECRQLAVVDVGSQLSTCFGREEKAP